MENNKPTRMIRIRRHFDSSHRLRDYKGPCANLHGHRWEVICTFEIDAAGINPNGISVDFKILKEVVDGVLPDHQNLNDLFEFNPTAENLVGWVFNRICEAVSRAREIASREFYGLGRLVSVELFETPECSVLFEVK